MWWPGTAELHSLIFLEAKSLKPRCCQGNILSGDWRVNSFLTSSVFWELPSTTSLAHGHSTPISDPCSTSLLFCVSPPKLPLPLILQEYMRFHFSLTWMSQSKLYSPFLKLNYVFFHIRQYSPFAVENSSHRFQGFGCGLMEGRASFSPLYQPK